MATENTLSPERAKKPPRLTAKQKKEAEEKAATELAAKQELLAHEEVLDEVQETHCIRHGNQRQRLRHGMKYIMYAAQFSPDAKLLLTCCSDKSTCLWDLKTGRELANYEHPDLVRCAVFSPDGTHICTGCDDREARLWKVEEKALITEAERNFKHGDWVVCVCYSSDGSLLCTVSRNSSVMIHDLSHCHTFQRRPSKLKALQPDGTEDPGRQGSKQRGSRQRQDSKDPFDTEAHERKGSKQGHKHGHKRHGEEENPAKKMHHDDNTWFACFSADAGLLVTASGWERGNAIVFDVDSMDELLRIPHKDWTMSARFCPMNNLVLTTCRDKKARIFELPPEMLYGNALQDEKNRKADLERQMKEAQAGQKKLVISKKKQKELAEAAEREKIAETLHAKEMSSFEFKNWNLCATWSHDGKRICAGSDDGCIQIFDVLTGKELLSLDQQEQILDVQWSPTDRKICAASQDGSARVFGGLQTLPTPEPPPKAVSDAT